MYTKKKYLQVLDTGKNKAVENMALDLKLLEKLDPNEDPILHLYDWSHPSITYGYFSQPEKYLHLNELEKEGIDIARRPTGGGIVFHLWDYAFSFLMPANHPFFSTNTLENYERVNSVVKKAIIQINPSLSLICEDAACENLERSNFCMARPTIYDVILEHKKVAGAAQRKTKKGYLHQGTISLCTPDATLLKKTLKSEDIVQAILTHSFIPKSPLDKKQIADLLKSTFEESISQV